MSFSFIFKIFFLLSFHSESTALFHENSYYVKGKGAPNFMYISCDEFTSYFEFTVAIAD